MAKEFNTEVTCDPRLHYMVDTTNKMKVFERLIERKKYFTINRARQFGKSTSLKWIYTHLNGEYLVVVIDFNNLNENDCISDTAFCKALGHLIDDNINDNLFANIDSFHSLDEATRKLCENSSKPIVLIIDNADRFIIPQLADLLSHFRAEYIERNSFERTSIFHSVILVSVKDITNLPLIIEERKFNSPWNVAANYKLDMTFNPQEISTMLVDYESEKHIGFNIDEISQEIYKYTSGYPVLVSAVCKEIDENLDRDWTKDGVLTAVNNLIKDNSAMLFKDITKNIENNPDLKKLLRAISMENFKISYYTDIFPVELGRLFSLLKADKHSCAQIHNLIFQQRINNYFIAENQFGKIESNAGPSVYTDKQGDLNMPLIINRFKDLVSKKHSKEDEFLEREGRFMFICFLKPIINGTGFYYSEPENDDGSRMDLVITYNHKEYVVELKIWHGTEYELSGRDQLSEYLDTRHLDEGYLVTFSFLKDKIVQDKPEWIDYNGKRIYEAVI